MSFASVMAAKAPDAWWRQGESSGTTMVDSSGNVRHGTYVGGPTLGTPGLIHDGDTDTAVTYSKTATTYGSVPNAAWLNVTVFSFFARIKPATVTGAQAIAGRLGGLSMNDAWFLRLDDAILRLYVNRTAGDYPSVSLGTVAAGDEHSVGFSYNAGVTRVFLDGAFVGTLTSTVRVVSAALSLGRSGYGEPLGGVLDEVAFWSDTALTDADHADMHAAAVGTGMPAALSATLAGNAGLTPRLNVTASLAAAFAAGSGLTADLAVVGKAQLAAALTATTTLTPDLRVIGAPVDLAATLAGAASLSANLRHIAIVGTSTRYANDGYGYDGMADVYNDPAIEPTPAHIPRSKVQQVHQSMSAPNLVNGVPR